jgi:hypothetical protein
MPIMWETFATDLLVKTGTRNVLGLAHPNSNIIKHVRRIHLRDRPNVAKEEDQLPRLLAAIPRNQLRGFKSRTGVPIRTLQLLLQLHTKLKRFEVSEAEMSHILQSPWIDNSLSELARMSIPVDTLNPPVVQKVWMRYPKLKQIRLVQTFLNMSSSSNLQESHFGPDVKTTVVQTRAPGTKKSNTHSLQLVSLYIDELVLPPTFGTMFQRIDIVALKELVLDGTTRVAGLLEAMRSEFQMRQPSLRELGLVGMSEPASGDFISQLQLFLLSFHGLHKLHIQCGNCIKINVDDIVNHGETLTELLVVNGGIHRQDSTRCFNAEDLQKVATACPRLERLCLNLYEIVPDVPEGDFLGPYPTIPSDSTEFEKALIAIASIRSLKWLRLTNPPSYRSVYQHHHPGEFVSFFLQSLESGEQQYAFEARADSIIRYMGDRGSNIEFLSFSPIENLTKATSADKNGHVWPRYFVLL